MKNSEKIKELRKEIKRLEEEDNASLIETYSYLVGTYLHHIYGRVEIVEKVTKINFVDYDKDEGYAINYDCISVSYDYAKVKECSISFGDSNEMCANDLDSCSITSKKFNEIFDKCVSYMKSEI
jgi:hypothetical protein